MLHYYYYIAIYFSSFLRVSQNARRNGSEETGKLPRMNLALATAKLPCSYRRCSSTSGRLSRASFGF